MKRGIVFLLIFAIIIIPTVSATISITNPSSAQYNVGEQIEVEGYIQQTNDLDAKVQISLVCSSKTYKFPGVEFSASAGERISFSELSLPTLTASSSMQGMCKVKGDILLNGATAETTSSTSFEI